MVQVAPIRLRYGSKVLWFDPNGFDVCAGDEVIVTTARGTEFGVATSDILEVSDELIEGLNSTLQPVIRFMTDEDRAEIARLEQKGEEALVVFKEIVAESHEDMHPVMVEFLLDGDKAVFYFEAEERVDFRDLVKKFASRFHVRVDMRQIGVRDGARILGGIGHCGQELCCKRLGGEFSPVMMRMAKEQNLSLNQQKISGLCGRLMCCLRYEYETYKDFNARAPKMGAQIKTPQGMAKVSDINVPKEQITLVLEDNSQLKVPLSAFDAPEEGQRPSVISEEAFKQYSAPSVLEGFEMLGVLETAHIGQDLKLATSPDHTQQEGSSQESIPTRRKPRRRHRARSSSAQANSKGESNSKSGQNSKSESNAEKRRTEENRTSKQQRRSPKKSSRNDDAQSSKRSSDPQSSRQRRRRSDNRSGSAEEKRGKTQGQKKQRQNNNSQRNKNSTGTPVPKRPGQKSSGLSELRNQSPSASPSRNSGAANHRKPRRRHHATGGANVENTH